MTEWVTPGDGAEALARALGHHDTTRAMQAIMRGGATGRVPTICSLMECADNATTHQTKGKLPPKVWAWIETNSTAADWDTGDFFVDGWIEDQWLRAGIDGLRVSLPAVLALGGRAPAPCPEEHTRADGGAGGREFGTGDGRDQERWVSAQAVRDALTTSRFHRFTIAARLIEAMRDGAVRARCARLVAVEQGVEEVRENVEVDAAARKLLDHADGLALASQDLELSALSFRYTRRVASPNPRLPYNRPIEGRVAMYGLEFRAADLAPFGVDANVPALRPARTAPVADAPPPARAPHHDEAAPDPLAHLDQLPDEALRVGEGWAERGRWPWHDAVAWIATRDATVMQRVAAYRAFADGRVSAGEWNLEVAAGAVLIVMRDALQGADLLGAARKLAAALGRGELGAVGREGGRGVPIPIPAATWDRFAFVNANLGDIGPPGGGELWFGGVMVEGTALLARWPTAPATGEVARGPGRPTGTNLYPSDAAIVAQVIALCDGGKFTGAARVRAAVKSLISSIEPPAGDDEGKIKRVRSKVLKARPDLQG